MKGKCELLVSDFDYDLPTELIAQYPAAQRDASRMMVLNRKSGEINHTHFKNILDYLEEGDLLVFNETKVFPAGTVCGFLGGCTVLAVFLPFLPATNFSPSSWLKPAFSHLFQAQMCSLKIQPLACT
jgi:S-adenosylmethionine:tRNA-ribosyltransferase-isomerase (queuine synthetase)